MPFKIVRNDITKMETEAIVNTANSETAVGRGCDSAVYKAAGYDELLAYRRDNIGKTREGDVFITPGFNLKAKYIIHAVSPLYIDGENGEEEILRTCYRKSLKLARDNKIKSIAFPLISTGAFGYPKEEGLRIAADEFNAFLLQNEMDIYLVVFDANSTFLAEKICPDLEKYIDHNYVERAGEEEYDTPLLNSVRVSSQASPELLRPVVPSDIKFGKRFFVGRAERLSETVLAEKSARRQSFLPDEDIVLCDDAVISEEEFDEAHESKLEERLKHASDNFAEYLKYLIQDKGMDNPDVYRRAVVSKKNFSKIMNETTNPSKITALCLCVGAKLNLDETKDLLARAGYALSPSNKTDIIFAYFIENKIYDMIELDIQLEEHGLKCIIQ